ncbi:MAG: prepilin-type N-terminal cleavage/methylation domain-containing protein [Phycisphaerae bacterium]|nr:prepilin-type N-terminal cleavage/methylation domain-containing protein [Phycisphaerae bacterium]
MRSGFTLVELLVVITIISLLAVLTLPGYNHARELARRTTCKAQIKGIAEACVAYMNDPAMHRRSNYANAMPTVYPTQSNWYRGSSGNPSALWLLVAQKFVDRANFLCPSAEVYRDFRKPVAGDLAFEDDTLSYSYLSQVKFTDANNNAVEVAVTSSFSTGLKDTELAVIADANPRFRLGTSGSASSSTGSKNSFNHMKAGQNVGFLGGNADWFTSPSIPGTRPLKNSEALDDIYRSCGGAAQDSDGKRGALNDAFLIP